MAGAASVNAVAWQQLMPHFLRPQWLWLLLGLPLLWGLWHLRQRRGNVWSGVVDAHLLPHLLVGGGRTGRWGLVAAMLGFIMAVIALAGPSWRQVAQPVWRSQSPLVLALDLSDRVLAPDLPPSRLLQARAKLARLLQERAGGQVALVAYAGDAFTVAPLTPDNANVALFLDALEPSVIPVPGQRADRAISLATQLLQQAGFEHGEVLLLTDQADADAHTAAARARQWGIRVSVLGLGTAAGAAYRAQGGAIERAALDAGSLQSLAASGGGRYVALTSNDADLHALGVLQPAQAELQAATGEGARDWEDQGYWLLPGLMLLVLFAFRRRGLAALVLCCCLPLAPPAQAEPRDWWQRSDQQLHGRLARGADAYRRGEFAAAEAAFDGIQDADAQYNLGNALAKQQRYDEAIAAYDRALALRPGMDDAVANRAAVEAARKRQPPGPPPPKQGGNGQGDDAGQKDGPPPPSGQSEPGQAGKNSGKAGEPRQPGTSRPPPEPPAAPADPQQQQAADAAQRQRMQQALQGGGKAAPPTQARPAAPAETAEQREKRQAVEAWLRRVPDDPGGLLRAKFELEHQRRQEEGR